MMLPGTAKSTLLVMALVIATSGCQLIDPAPAEEEEIFLVAEEMPVLIGGIESLQSKIEYPRQAKEAGVEGRVFLQVVVNRQGRAEHVSVVRGIGAGCDEEAVRVARAARFIAGREKGEPVKVGVTLPLTFKLR